MEPLLPRATEEEKGPHPLASPFALGTLALVVQQFITGVMDGIYGVPITYYQYDVLGISGDTKYLLNIALSLPECIRILLVAPAFFMPWRFRRVKLFWVIGIVLFCAHYAILGLLDSNITIQQFIIYGILGKIGENLMSGILSLEYIERTKLETLEQRGYLIVICNLANYLGSILGYFLDLIFYDNTFSWSWVTTMSITTICWIVALTPLFTILPFIYFYQEDPSPPKSPSRIFRELFGALSSPDLLVPLLVIQFDALLDVSNGSTDTVLIDGCGVTTEMYLTWKIIKEVVVCTGIVAYLKLTFSWDFVHVVIICLIIYKLCEANLAWLVVNDGKNALYESSSACLEFYGALTLSADTIAELKSTAKEVIKGILIVSRTGRTSLLSVLFASMDSTYSLINSIMSDELMEIWPTSASAIESRNFSGFWRLQLLTSLGPLLFQVMSAWGLPRSRQEQAEAAKTTGTDVILSEGALDTEEGEGALCSPKLLTGHWKGGVLVSGLWAFAVCFAYWWTYHEDVYGYELHWKFGPSFDFSDFFIFWYLVLMYAAAACMSLAIGLGLVNHLRRIPGDDL